MTANDQRKLKIELLDIIYDNFQSEANFMVKAIAKAIAINAIMSNCCIPSSGRRNLRKSMQLGVTNTALQLEFTSTLLVHVGV